MNKIFESIVENVVNGNLTDACNEIDCMDNFSKNNFLRYVEQNHSVALALEIIKLYFRKFPIKSQAFEEKNNCKYCNH